MGNENSKTQSGSHHRKNKTPHSHQSQNVEVDNFLTVTYFIMKNPLYQIISIQILIKILVDGSVST